MQKFQRQFREFLYTFHLISTIFPIFAIWCICHNKEVNIGLFLSTKFQISFGSHQFFLNVFFFFFSCCKLQSRAPYLFNCFSSVSSSLWQLLSSSLFIMTLEVFRSFQVFYRMTPNVGLSLFSSWDYRILERMVMCPSHHLLLGSAWYPRDIKGFLTFITWLTSVS